MRRPTPSHRLRLSQQNTIAMSKIQFDPALRTFSYNGAVVEGKAHIVYKDGKVVDGGGRVTFDPKGVVSIESRGSTRFGSMQCKEARFLGSAVFDKVKCDKFHSGGSLSCESIVADTVSINGGTDEHGYGSNTIGSITASVATIGGSDSSFMGKILKGVNGGSTFYIKTLDCDTAYLDGDVTIDVMRCSGICKVKGDKVKILKEER